MGRESSPSAECRESAPPTPYEVADRLHSAAIHLLRRARRDDERSGLSAARLSALSVLVFGGPTTLGGLAAAEQVRPPTMTQLVARLEKEGYVSRRRDTEDRRQTWVEATAKGRRALQAARRRRIGNLTTELEGLGARDLRRLKRTADQLLELLADDGSR